MENNKLKKFIKTTIREFLNENKYVDDILDRKNKYGKISDGDKEYLDKYSKGEDVSDLEKNYDVFKKFKDNTFKKRIIDKDWDFIKLSNNLLYFDNDKKIMLYENTIYFNEVLNFNVYIENETELENNSYEHYAVDFILKEIYFSENKNSMLNNINNIIKNNHINNDRTDGDRWVVYDNKGVLEIGLGFTNERDYNDILQNLIEPITFFKVTFK